MKTLYEFIREQDPERIINQFDWTTCAIGDYYQAIGRVGETQSWDIMADLTVKEDFLGDLSLCDTYGDAQRVVEEWQV